MSYPNPSCRQNFSVLEQGMILFVSAAARKCRLPHGPKEPICDCRVAALWRHSCKRPNPRDRAVQQFAL